MDLGTALIGIISTTVCAIPFVITTRSRKKNEKALISSLKELAKKQDSEITQYETCGNYAIGIDETKNFVFFQLKNKNVIKEQFIDLATIKKCKLANYSSSNSYNDKEIEQLNLDFIPINKNQSNILFEFYNSEESFQLSGELQSIQKWNKLINNKLESKK
ncbi:hypothetical protein [Lutibacter citreus]|uniref:hypothetical protein n=1 Tax=Lutibacter citreus TaxID=2138210 RepID=UPI000DBE3390|nr:hypothetical protein [Lutibacter citreus]